MCLCTSVNCLWNMKNLSQYSTVDGMLICSHRCCKGVNLHAVIENHLQVSWKGIEEQNTHSQTHTTLTHTQHKHTRTNTHTHKRKSCCKNKPRSGETISPLGRHSSHCWTCDQKVIVLVTGDTSPTNPSTIWELDEWGALCSTFHMSVSKYDEPRTIPCPCGH